MTQTRTALAAALSAGALSGSVLTGCELAEPNDVMGNFEVHYVDNMRVYINDELVAEVRSGEDATVEWNGETFQVSTLCSDEGTECPAETFWGQVAIDQPWGADYQVLNFVNLDTGIGVAGQRIGGLLDDDGAFAMLSGLGLSGNSNCAAIGVGTVRGVFRADNSAVEDGVITYEWAAGCKVGDADIGGKLRLETDYTAVRVGDYDISSVDAEAPIDEEGERIDPGDPDEAYSVDDAAASFR